MKHPLIQICFRAGHAPEIQFVAESEEEESSLHRLLQENHFVLPKRHDCHQDAGTSEDGKEKPEDGIY